MEEVVEEATGLRDATLHDGEPTGKEGDHAIVQHLGGRHATERAVGEQTAKADREQEQRLEALDDREVHHDQAERNHDELAHAVGHAQKRLDLMPLDEGAITVEVAADPVTQLHRMLLRGKRLDLDLVDHPETITIRIGGAPTHERLREVRLRRTIRLLEVARDVGRGFLHHEAGDARVLRQILNLAERLLPSRYIRAGPIRTAVAGGEGRQRAHRHQRRHQKLLHLQLLLSRRSRHPRSSRTSRL